MIAKIKVGCSACMGLGYKQHYHTNKCYTGFARLLICNRSEKLKEDCRYCDNLGYTIYTGEVLELNPPERL